MTDDPRRQHHGVDVDAEVGLGSPGHVDREPWGERDRPQHGEAPTPEGHDGRHRGVDGHPLPSGEAERAQGRLVGIQLGDLPAQHDADGHGPGEGRHPGEDPQGQFEDVDGVPGPGGLGLQAHHAEEGRRAEDPFGLGLQALDVGLAVDRADPEGREVDADAIGVLLVERRGQHEEPGRAPELAEVERPPDDPHDLEVELRSRRRPVEHVAGERQGHLLRRGRDGVEAAAHAEVEQVGQPLADGDLVDRLRIGLTALDDPRAVDHRAEAFVHRRRHVHQLRAVRDDQVLRQDRHGLDGGQGGELLELGRRRLTGRDLQLGGPRRLLEAGQGRSRSPGPGDRAEHQAADDTHEQGHGEDAAPPAPQAVTGHHPHPGRVRHHAHPLSQDEPRTEVSHGPSRPQSGHHPRSAGAATPMGPPAGHPGRGISSGQAKASARNSLNGPSSAWMCRWWPWRSMSRPGQNHESSLRKKWGEPMTPRS